MGEQGRAHVLERFSMARYQECYVALLARLAAQ